MSHQEFRIIIAVASASMILFSGCGADTPYPTMANESSPAAAEIVPAQEFACEPGTWSMTGTSSPAVGCRPASPGFFVSTTGARSEVACPPGSYASQSGARSCLEAPFGAFVATAGSTTATPCPVGTFAESRGQTDCEPAPPGTHVPSKGMSFALPCPTAVGEGTIWCVPDAQQTPIVPPPSAPQAPAPTPPVTVSELREVGTPYIGDDGLTVTVLSITVTERPGSFVYSVSYRLENSTAGAIDEGSFKLFGDAGSLPQYGFFSRMFTSDVIERTANFEEEKSKPFLYLAYHSNQFFAGSPPRGALVWQIVLP